MSHQKSQSIINPTGIERFTPEQEIIILNALNTISARTTAFVSNLSYIRHVVSLLAIAFLVIVIISLLTHKSLI